MGTSKFRKHGRDKIQFYTHFHLVMSCRQLDLGGWSSEE